MPNNLPEPAEPERSNKPRFGSESVREDPVLRELADEYKAHRRHRPSQDQDPLVGRDSSPYHPSQDKDLLGGRGSSPSVQSEGGPLRGRSR